VPGLPVHLDTTSSIPLVFHAIQRASRMLKKHARGSKLLFGLFGLSRLSGFGLNGTNQMNQINPSRSSRLSREPAI